ncbi:hypothetical protein CAC42_2903 [Sphaceloma murrayae]|uniref:Uncharacterized protein n=1 Tax=Sphaceloma murrayae TaxID=2082308 RepID=A0A2K1R038_9PEZI|nr:hypothetical protein CAC42_2903 [Sphaceloma murrayae]
MASIPQVDGLLSSSAPTPIPHKRVDSTQIPSQPDLYIAGQGASEPVHGHQTTCPASPDSPPAAPANRQTEPGIPPPPYTRVSPCTDEGGEITDNNNDNNNLPASASILLTPTTPIPVYLTASNTDFDANKAQSLPRIVIHQPNGPPAAAPSNPFASSPQSPPRVHGRLRPAPAHLPQAIPPPVSAPSSLEPQLDTFPFTDLTPEPTRPKKHSPPRQPVLGPDAWLRSLRRQTINPLDPSVPDEGYYGKPAGPMRYGPDILGRWGNTSLPVREAREREKQDMVIVEAARRRAAEMEEQMVLARGRGQGRRRRFRGPDQGVEAGGRGREVEEIVREMQREEIVREMQRGEGQRGKQEELVVEGHKKWWWRWKGKAKADDREDGKRLLPGPVGTGVKAPEKPKQARWKGKGRAEPLRSEAELDAEMQRRCRQRIAEAQVRDREVREARTREEKDEEERDAARRDGRRGDDGPGPSQYRQDAPFVPTLEEARRQTYALEEMWYHRRAREEDERQTRQDEEALGQAGHDVESQSEPEDGSWRARYKKQLRFLSSLMSLLCVAGVFVMVFYRGAGDQKPSDKVQHQKYA